ncbi:MAG TPA: stomatin-like protein [Termitinemataceae bacterium]|uniref:SPFH domain-containing protein n=1 Tax=Treponema sp. J25 TaxID=2094121 RepID=UPI001050E43F|nr:stomatin-like protein [Treponema sp. J25]TCW60121.1 paraslipin [Treponema sp. J25]HOJ98095.1 stomatin-like protein [Termitinemataceae bacterium]HOM22342.1 stomatin-like protein [Termitinemataceae bacterium]HPP99236.1 stomatin-like protein [Termitinemataceae bacterium]
MLYIIGAVALLVIIIIIKGIHLVPQKENWLVERFGKYEQTLKPGLNLINPIFARIAAKIDIREQVLDLPPQGIITEDNATVKVDGVVFFKITDPFKAYYGIQNLKIAIENLALTSLRSIMGKLTLDNSLSSRDKINAELLEILDNATDPWGTKITRVEIKDIQPPEDLQKAMAMQMKAERERRATVLEAEAQREAQEKKAEGFKRAQILEAEARKVAAELDAEARERLALAESRAIESVSQTLRQTGGDPVTYLLGIEYIKSLAKLGQSEGSRIIVLPADLLETIKNLFKTKA